ncbi:hypothetical protein KQI52_14195 [bacterium]|nr:hypothetical protein [bacterium]
MNSLGEQEPVLVAIVEALQRHNVDFRVIGALVPELLLEQPPRQRTLDVDIVLLVDTLDEYDQIKAGLFAEGFKPSVVSHRITWNDRNIDLLPYGPGIVQENVLLLHDTQLSVIGFEHLSTSGETIRLNDQVHVNLAPVPLYTLLKLSAYNDRSMIKDVAGIFHCLKAYAVNDDRVWGLEHEGELLDVNHAAAYLLGKDTRQFLTKKYRNKLQPVLQSLLSIQATSFIELAREEQDEDIEITLEDIRQRFYWYGVGMGWDDLRLDT